VILSLFVDINYLD